MALLCCRLQKPHYSSTGTAPVEKKAGCRGSRGAEAATQTWQGGAEVWYRYPGNNLPDSQARAVQERVLSSTTPQSPINCNYLQ